MTVITHDEPSAVIHPDKARLDFPALAAACTRSERAAAFRLLAFASLKVRNRRFDPTTAQPATKVGAVIGLVRHQFFGASLGTTASLRHTDGLQSRFCQRDFVRLGAIHMQANGQSVAIDHRHHLRAFAESFIKTLKYEELHLNDYESFADAYAPIERFLEDVYNHKRLHAALGYRPPAEFEQALATPTLP